MAVGRAVVIKLMGDASSLTRALGDASGGLGGLQQKLGSAGRDMVKAGGVLSAITAPITGLGFAAVQAGGEFQTQMNRVRAVSGATGDTFTALSDQAKELGRTTQFTAGQAADAMGFLAMAGFKADQIMAAMPSTLQLAAAAQLDLGRAADITSNILTGYGLEVANLGHANDVLVKAMTSTNVDLNMLGEAFKYVGPVAKGAGVAFEEAAAAIGLMGNAGIQGSMAGTSLRGAITRLLNPTAQVAEKMKELGLDVLDSQGNLQSLEEIVRQLESSGATTADMMVLFGQRAGPAMAALTDQGAEALRDLTGELGSAGGIAESVANIQMEGFNGAMLRAKSAFEGFAIAIAEAGVLDALAAGLEKVATWFQSAAEKFSALDPRMQQFLILIGVITAALGPLLVVLGMAAIAVAAISTPVLIIIGVLVALGVAIAAVIIWWDEIVAAVGRFVGFLRDVAERAVGAFVDFVDSKFGLLLLLLGPAGIAILVVTRFRDRFADAFKWMKDRAGEAIDGIRGFLSGLGDAFQRVYDRIAGIVSSIASKVQEAKDLITGLPGAGIVGGALSFGGDALSMGISGLDRLFGGGRALGGPVRRGTAYLVGERGPELYVPEGNGRIVPNHALRGGGSGETHIPVYLGDRMLVDLIVTGAVEAVRTGRLSPGVLS